MNGSTVWLASYPKSGNTWLRAVFAAWRTGGPVSLDKLAGTPIASSRVDFDLVVGIQSSDLTDDEIDVLRPRVDELLAANEAGPFLRKVHDGFFPGPSGEPVVSINATRSAIYVIRDPRDVAVSLAHHEGRTLQQSTRRISDSAAVAGPHRGRLLEQFRQRLGTWSQHVLSWVDQPPFPVHVLRYEDCVADPVRTFGAALRFAGFEAAAEQDVATAVDHASFQRLRQAEQRGGFRERPAVGDRFFRLGVAAGWRQALPQELAQQIEQDHQHVMARFGYL